MALWGPTMDPTCLPVALFVPCPRSTGAQGCGNCCLCVSSLRCVLCKTDGGARTAAPLLGYFYFPFISGSLLQRTGERGGGEEQRRVGTTTFCEGHTGLEEGEEEDKATKLVSLKSSAAVDIQQLLRSPSAHPSCQSDVGSTLGSSCVGAYFHPVVLSLSPVEERFLQSISSRLYLFNL